MKNVVFGLIADAKKSNLKFWGGVYERFPLLNIHPPSYFSFLTGGVVYLINL